MDLSVIIPCYNSGAFLPEALNSVNASTNLSKYDFEVIIVNDGSTDQHTLDLLGSLSAKYKIIHQENAGPGSARNAGMKESKGECILFLDSDNRLLPTFIVTCMTALVKENADMVYCQPIFFGETTESRFRTKKFNLNDILWDNYIDTCSIITRKVWIETGGFDESPIVIGYEDWELWIRIGSAGYKMHLVEGEHYEYRISKNSLVARKNSPSNRQHVLKYLYNKHMDTIINSYDVLCRQKMAFRNRPFTSIAKYLYTRYIN